MENLHRKIVRVLPLLLLLLRPVALQAQDPCPKTHLIFDSARVVGANEWMIYFTFCMLGGYHVDSGAYAPTNDFWFEVHGPGVTICPGGFPSTLNSNQSAAGCTNCRNACATYDQLGNYHMCAVFPAICPPTSGSCISPCTSGPGTCVWYSSNDPTCNGGMGAGPCPAYNYYSFWGCGFNPLCPGQPTAGNRLWAYTESANGSGPYQEHCVPMFVRTCGGLPDSVIARGIANGSGYGLDCYQAGDTAMRINFTQILLGAIHLEAAIDPAGIRLNWQSTAPQNVDRYIVERSADGLIFEQLAEIRQRITPAKSDGFGHLDSAPADGRNYYRIIEIDFDGKRSRSSTVSVEYSPEPLIEALRVFPIPADDHLNVAFQARENARYRLTVHDAFGRKLRDEMLTGEVGENGLRIATRDFESGVYILEISDGRKRHIRKFLVR